MAHEIPPAHGVGMAWRFGISACNELSELSRGIVRGATGGGASAGALKDGTGSLAFFQVPTGKSNKKPGENP